MFERYTEKARRCIFWGRYEASTDGSPTIECEHLLLGMLRENHSLLGDDVDGAKFTEVLRLEITRGRSERPAISTSVDMPLADDAKRVLTFGAEEAERMGHKHIGPEHLLLGMLREGGSLAARLLRQHGIELGLTRARIAAVTHPRKPNASELSVVDRKDLHALVDTLPEAALKQAHNVLKRLQTWPPKLPPEIAELWRNQGKLPPGGDEGEMGGRFSVTGTGDHSRFSTRTEDGALIRHTREFFHGHEIVVMERFKMSEDSKHLKYSQHLRGPNREQQLEIDFDLTEGPPAS
jgi:hypothetical protein